ncbi:hypothetical protein ABZU88_23045 [Streptomyces sp. NPDC005245]|uniref:hypothetical protein n=1 Tax=Streptomyces sp. NPDC005245 TaxID=3157029 RepID=UPI00339DDB67
MRTDPAGRAAVQRTRRRDCSGVTECSGARKRIPAAVTLDLDEPEPFIEYGPACPISSFRDYAASGPGVEVHVEVLGLGPESVVRVLQP